MANHYDAIIIGAGQAGPSLAARCVKEGMKTAIIERHLFGGTCVNTGCIPTKTLVASARICYQVQQAGEFGVRIHGGWSTDMKAVHRRMRKIVDQSNEGVEHWMRDTKGLDVIEGHARFEGSHTLSVNNQKLTADKIFINVGARARIPDVPGLNNIHYFTNSDLVDVDFLPEHLVIIGGSYIGLEFAQMYRRFGSEVTIVEMSNRLLPKEDEDIAQAVQDVLQKEGVRFRLGAECIEVNAHTEGTLINLDCHDSDRKVTGSHVLLAVGRTSNTDDLGLATTQISLSKRGTIEVNEQLQTSEPHIWALGECNGRGGFTHTSYNDYEIVADQLFGNATRNVTDRIPCYGLFIDPPLARVGMNEQQAKQTGRSILTGKMPMKKVGRAREFGQTQGLMKVLIDAESEKLLGASLFGLSADEAIHSLLDCMYAEKSYTTIRDAVHIHPTVSELIPTLLQNLEKM